MSKNYANLLSLCVAKIAFSLISFFSSTQCCSGGVQKLKKDMYTVMALCYQTVTKSALSIWGHFEKATHP